MSSPQAVAADIRRGLARLDDVVYDELEDLGEDVREIEQSVTHVLTGRLRDSETVFGPFEQGDIVEVRITPVDVPYAEIEAERGDDHNFAALGRAKAEPRIQQATRKLERLGLRAVEGDL